MAVVCSRRYGALWKVATILVSMYIVLNLWSVEKINYDNKRQPEVFPEEGQPYIDLDERDTKGLAGRERHFPIGSASNKVNDLAQGGGYQGKMAITSKDRGKEAQVGKRFEVPKDLRVEQSLNRVGNVHTFTEGVLDDQKRADPYVFDDLKESRHDESEEEKAKEAVFLESEEKDGDEDQRTGKQEKDGHSTHRTVKADHQGGDENAGDKKVDSKQEDELAPVPGEIEGSIEALAVVEPRDEKDKVELPDIAHNSDVNDEQPRGNEKYESIDNNDEESFDNNDDESDDKNEESDEKKVEDDGKKEQPDGKNVERDEKQVEPDVQKVEPDVQKVEPDVQKVEPDVQKVEPDVQKMEPDVQKVEPDVQKVEPDVQKVEPDVQKVEPDVQKVEPDVQKVEPDVQKVEPDVQKVEPDVQKVEPDGKKVEPDVQKVEPDVQKVEPDVQKVEPDVQKVEPDVQKVEPDVQKVEPDVQKVEPDVQKVEPDVQKVEPDVQKVEPDVQKVEPDVQKVEPDVQKVEPDVQKVEPDVQKVEPDVQKVEPDVQKGEPDVQKVEPDVQKVEPDVQKVEPDGKKVETDGKQMKPNDKQVEPDINQSNADKASHQNKTNRSSADANIANNDTNINVKEELEENHMVRLENDRKMDTFEVPLPDLTHSANVTYPPFVENAPSDAPGEGGAAVNLGKLTASEKDQKAVDYNIHFFDLWVTRKISLHRRTFEARSEVCRAASYSFQLPTISIVMVFFNEEWTTLLRSVHSVMDKSPVGAITEIVLLDDCSNLDHLKEPLERYLQPMKNVRLIRATKRLGLIKARNLGFMYAKGEMMIYLDSHIECFDGWLEPLIQPITEDFRVVTIPQIDNIDKSNFGLSLTSSKYVGGLNFPSLAFGWKTAGNGDDYYVDSPTMPGGLYAISRKWFRHLGAYDPDLKIWGGENVEISLKVWMCGGSIKLAKCSHVAHVFRTESPVAKENSGQANYRNSFRVAEVWLDQYKHFYYEFRAYAVVEHGDVSDRKSLREKLKCHSFEWYLNTVYPELKDVIDEKGIYSGKITNQATGMCLAGQMQKFARLVVCEQSNAGLIWQLRSDGHLSTRDKAVDIRRKKKKEEVVMELFNPQKSTRRHPRWQYDKEQRLVRMDKNDQCLEADHLNVLVLAPCSNKSSQKWTLETRQEMRDFYRRRVRLIDWNV